MNIQNITSLAEQLQSLGIDNLGGCLAKHICFKPENFYLTHKISKGKELLEFRLHFEKRAKDGIYVLNYYDATLQQENILNVTVVSGIDIAGLEEKMEAINWKQAFNLDEKKKFDPNDKLTWENEGKIESIIESLAALEMDEQGRPIASFLKLKYWNGASFYELFGSMTPVKNKTDVSQRFYFSDNGVGISADEAYRFLQNKLLEKQMQMKRKQADMTPESENDEMSGTNGSGLLKKRRLSQSPRDKGKKVNQD
jgi:hypothetical protein